MSRRKTTPIDTRIRALTDGGLKALVTELAFDTALKQRMLHTARQETRRRKRRATKEAATR